MNPRREHRVRPARTSKKGNDDAPSSRLPSSMPLAARVALGVLLLQRLAYAADPEVADLEYDRNQIDECPDEGAFREGVFKRLGRNPFVPGAKRRIHVELARQRQGFSALVRVEESGRIRGERR